MFEKIIRRALDMRAAPVGAKGSKGVTGAKGAKGARGATSAGRAKGTGTKKKATKRRTSPRA